MSGNYNVASGQTGGTCWFNSLLNMLINTDNGLKVLWKKLQEIYPLFTDEEKKFFHSAYYLSCPRKSFHPIFFWRYINFYICAFKKLSPPHSFMHKNKELLEHLELNRSGLHPKRNKNITIENVKLGRTGYYTQASLKPILNHLGFDNDDFRVISLYDSTSKLNVDSVFKVRNKNRLSSHINELYINTYAGKYRLSGAILTLTDKDYKESHAFACIIRNGKGYIIDSNFPLVKIPIKWWYPDEIENFKNTYNKVYLKEPPNANKSLRSADFTLLFYTHPRVEKIAPYCYRKYNVENVMQENFLRKEILKYFNKPEHFISKTWQDYIIKHLQWKYNNASQPFKSKILNTLKLLRIQLSQNNIRKIIERRKKRNIKTNSAELVANFFKGLEPKKTRKDLLLNVAKNQNRVKIDNFLNAINKNAPYGRNRKGRVIHKGPRGGLYVIGPSGNKLYKFPI